MNSDYNKCSLEILAWRSVEGSDFPFQCTNCPLTTKQQLNCEMNDNTGKVVLEDENYQLTTCPNNYILPQHHDFLDKYYFLQEFPGTAENWESTDKLFWSWYCIYKSAYNRYSLEKQKEQMKK